MATNPIQYTSRTFLTALSDINSDPALTDKPDWFKRLIAGVVDVVSVWENATANNLYLRTAFTRRAIIDIAALIDYNPTPQVSASGIFLFDVPVPSWPATPFPFTAQIADLAVNGPSSGSSSALRYGARSSLLFSSITEAIVQDAGHISVSTGQLSISSPPTNLWYVGEKIRIASSGSLPTGWTANTDYFISAITLSVGVQVSVALSTSRALAFAGVVVVPSTVGAGNLTVTRLSRPTILYQQTDVAAVSIGNSDGVTGFQEFNIPQIGVQLSTLVVTVNGVQWTQTTTLALALSTDTVYRVYYNTDGSCTLRFGNGVYGAIPGNFAIMATYSYGGGAKSNISNVNQATAYAGSGAGGNINGAYNVTAVTGGADAEGFDSIRKNAPMLLKARSRFITAGDGVALTMAYGGFSQVLVNPTAYGLLTAQIVAVAIGGGAPNVTLRNAVVNYLTPLTPLSSCTITFDIGTFTPVTGVFAVKAVGGYLASAIGAYAKSAILLFFGDIGQEVVNAYNSYGIASAVSLINLYQGVSWGSADYAVFSAVLTALNTVKARAFYDRIQLSDFYSVLSAIPGLDYVTVSSCTIGATSWPDSYACGAAEIVAVNQNGSTITVNAS